jgi:NAD(P)-dependent dehydrogenase (short-subunit alcohol dehydrogenase family)
MSPQTVHQYAEKVALVSDASSPVGRAVAMQLALQGSYVIGLFQQPGGSLDDLVELGTLAYAVEADPSTDEGSARAANEVGRLFGRLDLLVNCLKFRPESSFESVTEARFLDTVRRNLGSVHFLTRAVFELMKDRPKPKIGNVVSASETGGDAICDASQAGIISLTASMAASFPSKFRVNCVQVRDALVPERTAEPMVYNRPTGVAPDDIARAVLFLLSPESPGVNGQVVKSG